MLLWVIGAGGLLGSALTREAQDDRQLFRGQRVSWRDTATASRELQEDLRRYAERSAEGPWAIIWAAGAGVIGTTRTEFERECQLVARFADDLARNRPSGEGMLFMASSAGVYAGSVRAPFDESTAPRPLNAYGEAKLRQEHLVAAALGNDVRVVLGRISTLYGPGQDLDKAQGLVSRLCLQAAMRRPIEIYVPMDTVRDYLYVDDAARLVHGHVAASLAAPKADPALRVLAAGRPTTIAEVVQVVQRISRTRIGVAQSSPPGAARHVLDLRVTTRFELKASAAGTPLPVGVHRVYDDILRQLAAGDLAGRRATR